MASSSAAWPLPPSSVPSAPPRPPSEDETFCMYQTQTSLQKYAAQNPPAETTHLADQVVQLNHSILRAFKVIVHGLVSCDPEEEQVNEKVENMKSLLSQFQQALNQLRPFQAKEDIILMLKEQLARKQQMLLHLDDINAGAKELLQGAADLDQDNGCEYMHCTRKQGLVVEDGGGRKSAPRRAGLSDEYVKLMDVLAQIPVIRED